MARNNDCFTTCWPMGSTRTHHYHHDGLETVTGRNFQNSGWCDRAFTSIRDKSATAASTRLFSPRAGTDYLHIVQIIIRVVS